MQATCIEQVGRGKGEKKQRLEELARELRDLRLKAKADHPEVTMEYLLVY